MDRDPDDQQLRSLRLSRVLRDIGVTRQMVVRRRETFLMTEKMDNVVNTIRYNRRYNIFVVGSQSEGTTTLDMNSDLDVLNCDNDFTVITDWADWEPGKICLLVIKNDDSPPQHCSLQILSCDCPLPETMDMVPAEWDVEEGKDGRVLLTNTWMDGVMKQECGRLFRKKGPSRSADNDVDSVTAFSYSGPMPECNFLFTRPKPGHWPRPEILAKARLCEIFLVPQGHAESDQSKLEWRFSTLLIERLIMFDLNILKIQVYTFLKILRKTFFKPLVGDRLSTFHFKTALLFTLETYPPEIWQERNLLQCVIYCLKTLQRWFKLRYCPHYTISGVDLFVGKLRKWEFPLLSTVLSDMIDNIMDYVSQIEMDQIGVRIGDGHVAVKTRYQNTIATAWNCFNHSLFAIANISWTTVTENDTVFEILDMITRVREMVAKSDIRAELIHAMKFMYQMLASISASTRLRLNEPISLDTYSLYEASLDSDLTSSRLKFASMLYCSGQYERAELMLAQTESLLHADVWQWCPCAERTRQEPTERFKDTIFKLNAIEVIKSHVAFSVVFNSLEICCMPAFLVYELYRTIGPKDVQHRHPLTGRWMDLVIIDPIVFLYYLQYLTYRQLGEHERKLKALNKLYNYVCFESECRGHIETALHVLGHCYELENRHVVAWACYIKSLELFPNNNAARWHITRLLQQA
ncbi:uncharacterized protein LOC128224361 [Mya arenaria]|uniref:uncharacterized protein LOC128224361 n=1 Tax=Mya arenaria TaxID=6604 RepID=UPI0022E04A2F|nr:uncharacterized protein LOC128224361 [Mya arenaria]